MPTSMVREVADVGEAMRVVGWEKRKRFPSF